jgi:hypothetical protein
MSEEFSKIPFPTGVVVNDEVQQKLLRISSIFVELGNEWLIALSSDELFIS